MSFTFPDPNVTNPVTHPDTGITYVYADGMWSPVSSDAESVDLNELSTQVQDIGTEVEENEESIEAIMPSLLDALTRINDLRDRLEDVEELDITNALSALALAQADIIDLKSKVSTLELTSFLILE